MMRRENSSQRVTDWRDTVWIGKKKEKVDCSHPPPPTLQSSICKDDTARCQTCVSVSRLIVHLLAPPTTQQSLRLGRVDKIKIRCSLSLSLCLSDGLIKISHGPLRCVHWGETANILWYYCVAFFAFSNHWSTKPNFWHDVKQRDVTDIAEKYFWTKLLNEEQDLRNQKFIFNNATVFYILQKVLSL